MHASGVVWGRPVRRPVVVMKATARPSQRSPKRPRVSRCTARCDRDNSLAATLMARSRSDSCMAITLRSKWLRDVADAGRAALSTRDESQLLRAHDAEQSAVAILHREHFL